MTPEKKQPTKKAAKKAATTAKKQAPAKKAAAKKAPAKKAAAKKATVVKTPVKKVSAKAVKPAASKATKASKRKQGETLTEIAEPVMELTADESGEQILEQPAGEPQRLQKILAHAGVASRRRAEEMILEGRVQVNGTVVTELGAKADPKRDHVRVDGKLLQGPERLRYYLLNKPRGYVTTVSDPEGRPTVMELVERLGAERVYPVGRLDYLSEGLLLLTNDGELAHKLTQAASGVEKVYLVKVAGNPNEEEIERLRKGVMIERGKLGTGGERVRTAPAELNLARTGENPWFEVVLIEGRNREIRKMFEEIGHHVEKIRRVGYGPLVLDVEPGKVRELEAKELEALRLTAEGKLKPKRQKLVIPQPKKPQKKEFARRPEGNYRKPEGGFNREGGEKREFRPKREGSVGGEKREFRPKRTGSFGGEKREFRPKREGSFGGEKREFRPKREGSFGGEKREFRPKPEGSVGGEKREFRPKRTGSFGGEKREFRPKRTGSFGGEKREFRPKREGSFGGEKREFRPKREGSFGGEKREFRPKRTGSFGGEKREFRPKREGSFGGEKREFRPKREGSFGGEKREFRPKPAGSFGGEKREFRPKREGSFGGEKREFRPKPAGSFGGEKREFRPKREGSVGGPRREGGFKPEGGAPQWKAKKPFDGKGGFGARKKPGFGGGKKPFNRGGGGGKPPRRNERG